MCLAQQCADVSAGGEIQIIKSRKWPNDCDINQNRDYIVQECDGFTQETC